MKALFYNRIIPSLVLAIFFTGCATSDPSQEQQPSREKIHLENTFGIAQKETPPNEIQSIQLHPEGEPGQPPIIRLNGSQKLQLSFDFLGTQNRQFRVRLTHYDKSWNQSSIGPNTYLDSFSETTIQPSNISFGQRPSYHHVEFTFPNNELKSAVSGNYLLHVFAADGNDLLFSMPFFITEDEGQIATKVERRFAQRRDGRPLDQLYSTYTYPDFVEYPQFDLAMTFVQNQFWGRAKLVEFLDTITPGQLRGYLERDNTFVGNYEFKQLDLRNFNTNGQRILDYQPGATPPKVILRRDVQNLDTTPNLSVSSMDIGAKDDPNSKYAQVEFRLETDERIAPTSDIYIVGSFNNWMINELNKLRFDSSERIWTGQALIKQGTYAYKYIIVRDNRVDDLTLDQGFVFPQQEYLTFIYFKDPNKKFDRLLKIDRVIKR